MISLRKVPNILTIIRSLLGIPLLLSLLGGNYIAAWFILLFGGITDFLDGHIARKIKNESAWGAKLDPLADKIFISAPIIWLSSVNILPVWSVWVLFSRELIITCWRSEQKNGGPASTSGKAKTILQFISIVLMLWPTKWGGYEVVSSIHGLGLLIFWISLFIAILSAYKYIKTLLTSYPS